MHACLLRQAKSLSSALHRACISWRPPIHLSGSLLVHLERLDAVLVFSWILYRVSWYRGAGKILGLDAGIRRKWIAKRPTESRGLPAVYEVQSLRRQESPSVEGVVAMSRVDGSIGSRGSSMSRVMPAYSSGGEEGRDSRLDGRLSKLILLAYFPGLIFLSHVRWELIGRRYLSISIKAPSPAVGITASRILSHYSMIDEYFCIHAMPCRRGSFGMTARSAAVALS